MSLLKLRLSMIGTLAFIVGASTLFFAIILSLTGTFNLLTLVLMVVAINIVQWLVAPYLIDSIYKVREISRSENPGLHEAVERLSETSGLKKPRLMIADIPIPNAFAYGSPIGGSRVAVTTGLMKELEEEEVEAVLAHELGHLKHRDVQIMMFASVLPAIFYMLGYSFMMSSMYGRGRRDGGGGAVLVGFASMVVYWILTMFVLGLSRLREYYADQHSISIVEDGRRKMSEGLAKIVESSGKMKIRRRDAGAFNGFKSLFISDPDRAATDVSEMNRVTGFRTDQEMVQSLLARKLTSFDRIAEVFSTHPNIVKRLNALQRR